jgi:hypothetical protein
MSTAAKPNDLTGAIMKIKENASRRNAAVKANSPQHPGGFSAPEINRGEGEKHEHAT